MSDTQIYSLEELKSEIDKNVASIVYFSSPSCNVCKVLRPKLMELSAKRYPDIARFYIDISQNPEIASHYTVFAAPTIIVFFESKEFVRKSRSMSPEQLMREIERPYSILTQ